MNINEVLYKIRAKAEVGHSSRQAAAYTAACFAAGFVAGLAAKYADGHFSNVLSLGQIGSDIGIWVLMAVAITVYSRTPLAAIGNVFAFFAAMLIAYYIYSMKLFGFFPKYYFLRWGFIAIGASLAASVVWFGKGQGYIAAFCAALPVGLLFSKGYSITYHFSVIRFVDMAAGIILLLILPKGWQQRLKVLGFALILAFLFRKFHVLTYLLGGL